MNLKFRLALMNFLEFAVWGAYLTCMGNYLGVAGLGDKISWFYAIQGIVSIFMPTLMGIVADKYIQPQRLLGLCHLVAGGFMLGCWWLGYQAGFGQELSDKSLFITLYTLSVAFFMPSSSMKLQKKSAYASTFHGSSGSSLAPNPGRSNCTTRYESFTAAATESYISSPVPHP